MPTKKSTAASTASTKPMTSKIRRSKVTQKLGPVNDEMEDINEQANALEEKQKLEKELQTLCESFIKGQGSIYVLERGNKAETEEGIVDNGPEYVEHAWNSRKINKGAIEAFFAAAGGSHRVFPKFQEYAITIAASSSLLDDITLSRYQSHDFPLINFKAHDNGNIYIVNGHHRIASWKVVHEKLLTQLHNYERLLKGGFAVTSDNDTPEIIAARDNVVELKQKLFAEGGWGAVVLDYDAIVSHSRSEEIKAYWARNLGHFHIPDTPQDMLQMILRAVRSMSPQRGFDFLESQISRSTKEDQAKLQPLIKNPLLLVTFSELMTLPMFEDTKLVTFHKLDKWRNMVPCWLNIFLNFARDSYRFVAFPIQDKLGSITEVVDCDASTTKYAFSILDASFHEIIDRAYKDHLAEAFLSFASPDGVVEIRGEEMGNWGTSFAKYRKAVLKDLDDWVQSPSRDKEYRDHYSALVDRVTYILDKAWQEYPHISKINVPFPLACYTFIQDLGQDLHQFEVPMFEFLTLFEPTIAMRYGPKKKFTTPFDIFEIFYNFRSMPSENGSLIDETISEIWASIYLSRHTVISAVATLHSQRKKPQKPIKASEVKKDSEHVDAPIALGLAEVLGIWVKAQRAIDFKNIKTLSADQKAFLMDEKNTRKHGCALPPSLAAMPRIFSDGFKFANDPTEEQKEEIKDCLKILQSSYYPWSAQYSSMPIQHHTGIAISTMQLQRDRDNYRNYLGEDIIWELFIKVLGLLRKFAPSFHPWHSISSENDRVSNPTQIILQQSLRKETIGPLLGATMAQQTAAINERYRVGLMQIRKAVQDMAVYVHEGQEYISYDVNHKLHDLYQTLAKECVHQAYQYEQDMQYLPPNQIDSQELDQILTNRLDFSFPHPNLQVMSNMQRSDWYGSDGMSKAYDFSTKSSFGNRVIEQEQRKQEVKAQKVIDNKAKKRASTSKRNTTAEDDAITRFDPSGSSKKRGRASDGASSRKKVKHVNNAGSSSDEVMGNTEASLDKNKGKGRVLVPDSDSDDEMDEDEEMDDDGEAVEETDGDEEMDEDDEDSPSGDSPPFQSP